MVGLGLGAWGVDYRQNALMVRSIRPADVSTCSQMFGDAKFHNIILNLVARAHVIGSIVLLIVRVSDTSSHHRH